MKSLNVEYQLTGLVNNCGLHVSGSGQADMDRGQYSMDLVVNQVPPQWDPAFVILICCDRMLGVCAREIGEARSIHSISDGNHILVGRSSKIYDEDGRLVGSAKASSIGHRTGEKLVSKSYIEEGTFNLLPGEQVTEIDAPYNATAIRLGVNGLIVTSSFTFKTTLGKKYYGYTSYPYTIPGVSIDVMAALPAVQLITVENVRMNRTNEADGTIRFHFELTQSIAAMAEILEEALVEL